MVVTITVTVTMLVGGASAGCPDGRGRGCAVDIGRGHDDRIIHTSRHGRRPTRHPGGIGCVVNIRTRPSNLR